MSNAIDLLKELNSKLLAKITKLKKENAKISELRKKFAEESIIPDSIPEPIHSSTQPQKDKSRSKGSLLCNKYLLESPTEPVTSITSLEFVEIIYKENVVSTISYEQKKEQGLIQEISAGNSQDDVFPSIQDHVTEILLTQNSNQVSKNHVSDITILSVSRKFIDDQDNSSNNLPKTDIGEKTLPEIELQISAELAQPKVSYAPPKLFPFKRKLSKEMHTEGEHQTDSYWVLGSYCPLCRENHMSLYEPGIPLNNVLKAYSGNSKQIQELKT
ncbi:9783_t:CDS:2 [Gigaspora margarita]|uniref:9783_t:CDS:1 n=1 Tax=Gigaspora margarita TaxID=4874 RepID=A0ABN7VJC6_GIGMA|nr:9783_t:CDS:2 [Gigaspora margarita]